MAERFRLRQVESAKVSRKAHASELSVRSPHHDQLLTFRFFPMAEAPQTLLDESDDDMPMEIFSSDWSIRVSHFQHLSQAWFGASLTQYQGALRQWVFDLVPICLGEDFQLHGLFVRKIEQNLSNKTGGDRYLLQCLAGETLLAQSRIEVNVSTPAASLMLMSSVEKYLINRQSIHGIRELNLLPEQIPPLVFHLDLGLFRPFNADRAFEDTALWTGSVWILEQVNLNAQGFYLHQLGSSQLLVDLKPASSGFGVLSMTCDEENLLEQPVIKHCLAVDQHVVVRAGSFDLSLEQIASLRRGELISLTDCEFPMVRLMSGNVEIGRAEMVECDGKPAIQIVDVYQKKTAA